MDETDDWTTGTVQGRDGQDYGLVVLRSGPPVGPMVLTLSYTHAPYERDERFPK